jgi:hypothetical protein
VVFSSLSSFLSERELGEYFLDGASRAGVRLDGVGRASVIIRETPRSVPYQGGWSLANIFIAYIPRILWPDKPIITIGQWITDTYGTGAQSATGPTWIGEFWMNFGLAGVLGGMFAMGLLLRLAHEIFLRRSRTIPAMLAIAVILYKLATTVAGGVVGAVNGVIFALVPIFFAHFVVGLLAGRERVQPAANALPGEIGSAVPPASSPSGS